MALAIETETTEVDSILAACAKRYAALRVEVDQLVWDRIELRDGSPGASSIRGVVVPRHQRIECVLPPTADLPTHVEALGRLAGGGWEVWALVPMGSMGDAHRLMRGVPVRLQAWWTDGGDIHFGRPETP